MEPRDAVNAALSPAAVLPDGFATTITCESINSGDIVSVFVYDYQGKLIRKLIQSEVVSSNDFETTWDGMNEQNREVLAGVYFLSITVNGQNFTKQLIKN